MKSGYLSYNTKRMRALLLILLVCVLLVFNLNTTSGKMFMAVPVQIDSSEFETVMDDFFAEKMAAYHIPGAVFVVVQDGEILLAKGYGVSDIDQQSLVSPDKTLFHLGSIAKLMTATAVMQLVERGKLDLHADVNRYLSSFQIDDTYPHPVTLLHLLTHTSGLEQHGIGTGARSADDFVDLSTYLQQRPPQRLMPPGEVIIYSSVGIAIAGQVVEEVTGDPFAEYVRQHIFKPLHMTHSAFVEPPNYPTTNSAIGYRYQKGKYIPYTETYYSLVAPGGDFVSTGLDMANFMFAYLENGSLADAQLLKPETVQYVQAQQVTNHPELRGRAIGFSEWTENEQRAIFHDGGAPGFLSRVFLVPEHRLGFFLAYNNGNAYRFKQEATSELLDLYFPDSNIEKELSTPEPNLNPSISEFAGYYRDYELSPSDIGKLSTLLNQIPVTVIDDQHIRVGSTEYSRVAPILFQTPDGTNYAAFRVDDGEITHLLLGTAAFERVNWFETQPFQTGLIVAFGLTFLIAVFSPLFTSLNMQPSSLFRWYASLICLLNLVFLIGLTLNLMSILHDPWSLIYGPTPTTKYLLIIPLVTSVLTLGLIVLALLAWRYEYWSLIGRISYTWVAITALGFIPFLRYWNLLR
jgi:CubicO group peptidase (beta-lactamase class C family)